MQQLLVKCADRLLDGPRHSCRIQSNLATEQSLDPRSLAASEVALRPLGTQYLSSTTDVEPFFGALVGLHLRHI